MKVRVRPVHLLGRAWHVFPRPDHQLEVVTDPEAVCARVAELHEQLSAELAEEVMFLEPAVVRDDADRERLRASLDDVDALLVNVSTGGLEGGLFDWRVPVIAYSGERTPMMALYNLPAAELERRPWVSYALDPGEVDQQLRLLRAWKRLRHSKLVVLGEYLCADKLPDPEVVRRKLGVEFVHVSGRDFVADVERVDDAAAAAVAAAWTEGAASVDEPSPQEILEGARVQLALERLLERTGAQATSVGCLELMYGHRRDPFCFALANLRDAGLPAGCEADAGATLTMLMLEYLAERPAYMGNLVHVDPEAGRIAISHGCSPSRVAGRDQPARPYRLVHSHSVPPFSRGPGGGAGVTSYVDYGDRGQVVTVARLDADVVRLLAARGEIVGCRDTICDRTTLTVAVRDARDFLRKATGNHQVVVYGDWVAELRGLCRLLGLELVEA